MRVLVLALLLSFSVFVVSTTGAQCAGLQNALVPDKSDTLKQFKPFFAEANALMILDGDYLSKKPFAQIQKSDLGREKVIAQESNGTRQPISRNFVRDETENSDLPPCKEGNEFIFRSDCFGTVTHDNGDKYVGGFFCL